MPKTADAQDSATDGSAHRQLSAMIDAGRAFSGNERNCCFLNTGGERFADLSAGSGLDFPDDGRAIAVTDWDQDGDLDLWISNRNAPRLRLLRNEVGNGNRFLALRLIGDGTANNRDAIGSRVSVKLRGEAGSKALVKSLRAGEGFLSQSSKWLHFGLGPHADGIEELSVRWPDGSTESFTGVEPNRRYRITRGSGMAEPLPSRRGEIALEPSEPLVASAVETARVPAVTLLPGPRLNLKRGDGSSAGMQAGRSLLINLWATWCAPCRVELAELGDRKDELRAAGLDVLALCVDGIGDESSDPSASNKVLQDLRFPHPSSMATEPLAAALQDYHNNLVGLNRTLPLPSSFLIDPQGRLSVIYKGPVSIDQLLADLGHSSGTLDERMRNSAPLGGSMIDHETVRHTARKQDASFHLQYGKVRLAAKDSDGALDHFQAAAELDPDSAPAAQQLALLYRDKQQWSKAAAQFKIAIGLDPENPDNHHALAQLHSRLGQAAEARQSYQEALRLKPDHALAHFGFAALLAAQGEAVASISHYRSGLGSQPDNHVAANNLAWLLATHPDDDIREPAEALRLAQGISTATEHAVPNILDTLAAAQAGVGDFDSAEKTAQRAIKLATGSAGEALIQGLRLRLALYKEDRAYRESPVAPGS